LESISKIFVAGLSWLLGFIQKVAQSISDNLNGMKIKENDEFKMLTIKANEQWLWLFRQS
jgi:hypothetical protein